MRILIRGQKNFWNWANMCYTEDVRARSQACCVFWGENRRSYIQLMSSAIVPHLQKHSGSIWKILTAALRILRMLSSGAGRAGKFSLRLYSKMEKPGLPITIQTLICSLFYRTSISARPA